MWLPMANDSWWVFPLSKADKCLSQSYRTGWRDGNADRSTAKAVQRPQAARVAGCEACRLLPLKEAQQLRERLIRYAAETRDRAYEIEFGAGGNRLGCKFLVDDGSLLFVHFG